MMILENLIVKIKVTTIHFERREVVLGVQIWVRI